MAGGGGTGDGSKGVNRADLPSSILPQPPAILCDRFSPSDASPSSSSSLLFSSSLAIEFISHRILLAFAFLLQSLSSPSILFFFPFSSFSLSLFADEEFIVPIVRSFHRKRREEKGRGRKGKEK